MEWGRERKEEQGNLKLGLQQIRPCHQREDPGDKAEGGQAAEVEKALVQNDTETPGLQSKSKQAWD